MAYLGIDLGTTNSVAVIFDAKMESLDIVNIDGIDEVLPSVVCFQEGETIVGDEAKNGAVIYPDTTITSIKRKMGEDESLSIGEHTYLPEEISAIIIKKLKDAAEEQAGEAFEEVVITHPAYFSDRQIVATKKAGELAGFNTVHLLSEPLAAAIEYGYKQGYAQTLMVYDLGGGTFDVCVLKVSQDVHGNETFSELSDVGDMQLGGDDFDLVLINYMMKKFEMLNSMNIESLEISEYNRILQRLKQESEQLKKKLSSTHKATVKIAPLCIIEGTPMNLILEITREDFEGLLRPFIDRTRDIMMQALERANLDADDISKVILVGGSTLIPMVKRMVAGTVKEPYRATDPAKSVAMGAAIYNYLIHLPNSPVKVGQITRKVFGTEAIIDIESKAKELIPIIPLGETIPVRITDDQFISSGGAHAVRVDVFQWEEGKEEERQYIGSVVLDGIQKDTKLAITYSINSDNIFEVYVKDQVTENEVFTELDRNKTLPELPGTLHTTESVGMNIVFIIDTTGSMETYIDGVKNRAIEFSNILKERNIDFNLGLIGFGDLLEKEKPKVYSFTKNVKRFQKRVKKIPRTYGGDIPESSLDAIETGVDLIRKSKQKEFKDIFILITDAPPHVPTMSGKTIHDICELLKKFDITTFIVARKDTKSKEAYEPLTLGKGHYYDMDEPFYELLDKIAYQIAELVRI